MTSCESCGKLIASGTGERLCRACRAENLAVPPAMQTPATAEVGEVPCVRCRRHIAMEDSHFCLGCQLELVNALGDAAEELFRTPPPAPLPMVSSTVSLMHDLEEKRDRTATSHIRVVGAVKIK